MPQPGENHPVLDYRPGGLEGGPLARLGRILSWTARTQLVPLFATTWMLNSQSCPVQVCEAVQRACVWVGVPCAFAGWLLEAPWSAATLPFDLAAMVLTPSF